MGRVIIQPYTTKDPISLMGLESAVCVGADVSDLNKNLKRGLDCIEAQHGRVLEFPQLYLEIKGYSARVIRELYTHIAGGPTRLQQSTRYIDYEHGFEFITPPSVKKDPEAEKVYTDTIKHIQNGLLMLDGLGVPREDSAMLLPLGMTSDIVLRTNLRNVVDMSRQRMCSRAYWEFRELFNDLLNALGGYSEEWKVLIEMRLFAPKCEITGYCTEKKSCKHMPSKKVPFNLCVNRLISDKTND